MPADAADYVFSIVGERLERLPARSFRSGLFGQTLEAALQTLIELHPDVLPGSQIEPSTEDPPRFALLRREMPIGPWSLDHVLVDQRGIVTLVEAKLVENPQARREVIGQVMEYAANAAEAWSGGRLRERATEFWQQRNRQIDDLLRERLGAEIDTEALWSSIEKNLSGGHFRLVIASDELRPEVRRIIEYLNAELQNVEVYGLELRCYGTDSSFILVPRLIGQTQATADRKAFGDAGASWTPDRLKEAYANIPDATLRRRLLFLFEWAERRTAIIAGRTKTPTLGVKGRSEYRVFSIYSDGSIYWVINDSAYVGGVAERDHLAAGLRQLRLVDPGLDVAQVASGRNLTRKLGELTEDEFSALTELLDSVVGPPAVRAT
jgi:hypothetical protein